MARFFTWMDRIGRILLMTWVLRFLVAQRVVKQGFGSRRWIDSWNLDFNSSDEKFLGILDALVLDLFS